MSLASFFSSNIAWKPTIRRVAEIDQTPSFLVTHMLRGMEYESQHLPEQNHPVM